LKQESRKGFGFCLPSDHVYSNQFFLQVFLAMASCCVCSVPSSPITGNCYGLEMERPTQCWNKEPPQTLMDWKRFSELPTIGCTERKITESMCSAACTKQIAYKNPSLKKWISQSNSNRAKASSSGDKQNRPQFESVAHNRLIYEFCTWTETRPITVHEMGNPNFKPRTVNSNFR
jgi:hypothetical protein